MPVRIQRKRTKGWTMPENTVYVGRGSTFGNPYAIGDFLSKGPYAGTVVKDNSHAVSLFREWVNEALQGRALPREDGTTPTAEQVQASIARLRGKNLACWCKVNEPCHADVLLELANPPPETE